jgi:hypothetical protein
MCLNLQTFIKIIIPIFKVYPIQGIKNLDYQDLCKVANLIDKGKHLIQKGLDKILLIKDRMNTKRSSGAAEQRSRTLPNF